MLVTLAIKDLAIIEDSAVEFGPGLCALTGQTGAGKSIIIGALGLILGERARTDAIRRGCERAEVSAVFRVPPGSPAVERLRELALIDEPTAGESRDDGAGYEVIIRRVIARKGKGRVWINGRLNTASNLGSITRSLVDISSQHQHTELLDPERHIDILDRFGDLDATRQRYGQEFKLLSAARGTLRALNRATSDRLTREDFARFQLKEIADLDPQDGEIESLESEQARLSHGDRLRSAADTAVGLLSHGNNSIVATMGRATQQVRQIAEIDELGGELLERLESARIELDDVSFELQDYAVNLDVDPRRLDHVQDRLVALTRLMRKHGGTMEAVLKTREDLTQELDGFDNLEIDIKEATEAVAVAEAKARAAAEVLSTARHEAAATLGERVSTELQQLAMSGAIMRFELRSGLALGPGGADAGEIEIQTNAGEGFGALVRVASGGELSRVLLALKRVLIHVDPVSTCIFDEVDSGTGGAVGDTIGLKLAEIAGERQVLVITHLAQIAARAQTHLRVEKALQRGDDGERTVSRVRALEGEERVDEIARMLGGVEITARIRAHAQELLSQ